MRGSVFSAFRAWQQKSSTTPSLPPTSLKQNTETATLYDTIWHYFALFRLKTCYWSWPPKLTLSSPYMHSCLLNLVAWTPRVSLRLQIRLTNKLVKLMCFMAIGLSRQWCSLPTADAFINPSPGLCCLFHKTLHHFSIGFFFRKPVVTCFFAGVILPYDMGTTC